MKYLLTCAMCLLAVCKIMGQEIGTDVKRKYAVVPPEQALALVVNQPKSPIEFQDIKAVISVSGWDEGHIGYSFRLRNRSTKPIRAYTVSRSGGEYAVIADNPKDYIMPGQLAPPFTKTNSEIVPLTDELRDKLKLRGEMKQIVMLMVVRVEYADGTVFDDTTAYNAMLNSLDKNCR